MIRLLHQIINKLFIFMSSGVVNEYLEMHSSNGGIQHNASYANSTTDLSVKTDNTNPSLAIKDRGTVTDTELNTLSPADNDNTIVKSYLRLYEICKLPAVRWYVLFNFTNRFALAAVHGVSDIKLVEYGLTKETKALLTVPFIPISIFVPVIISRWTVGPKPLSVWKKTFFLALLTSGIVGVMVLVTGTVIDADGGFPGWYFPLLVIVECAYKACQTTLSVSNVAFTAKISDPEYGCTFMTFYNTLSNLGSESSQALALWLVDPLTITKACNDATTACDKPTTRIFDGCFIETIVCILIGACWFIWARSIVNRLQKTPESEFKIKQKRIND